MSLRRTKQKALTFEELIKLPEIELQQEVGDHKEKLVKFISENDIVFDPLDCQDGEYIAVVKIKNIGKTKKESPVRQSGSSKSNLKQSKPLATHLSPNKTSNLVSLTSRGPESSDNQAFIQKSYRSSKSFLKNMERGVESYRKPKRLKSNNSRKKEGGTAAGESKIVCKTEANDDEDDLMMQTDDLVTFRQQETKADARDLKFGDREENTNQSTASSNIIKKSVSGSPFKLNMTKLFETQDLREESKPKAKIAKKKKKKKKLVPDHDANSNHYATNFQHAKEGVPGATYSLQFHSILSQSDSDTQFYGGLTNRMANLKDVAAITNESLKKKGSGLKSNKKPTSILKKQQSTTRDRLSKSPLRNKYEMDNFLKEEKKKSAVNEVGEDQAAIEQPEAMNIKEEPSLHDNLDAPDAQIDDQEQSPLLKDGLFTPDDPKIFSNDNLAVEQGQNGKSEDALQILSELKPAIQTYDEGEIANNTSNSENDSADESDSDEESENSKENQEKEKPEEENNLSTELYKIAAGDDGDPWAEMLLKQFNKDHGIPDPQGQESSDKPQPTEEIVNSKEENEKKKERKKSKSKKRQSRKKTALETLTQNALNSLTENVLKNMEEKKTSEEEPGKHEELQNNSAEKQRSAENQQEKPEIEFMKSKMLEWLSKPKYDFDENDPFEQKLKLFATLLSAENANQQIPQAQVAEINSINNRQNSDHLSDLRQSSFDSRTAAAGGGTHRNMNDMNIPRLSHRDYGGMSTARDTVRSTNGTLPTEENELDGQYYDEEIQEGSPTLEESNFISLFQNLRKSDDDFSMKIDRSDDNPISSEKDVTNRKQFESSVPDNRSRWISEDFSSVMNLPESDSSGSEDSAVSLVGKFDRSPIRRNSKKRAGTMRVVDGSMVSDSVRVVDAARSRNSTLDPKTLSLETLPRKSQDNNISLNKTETVPQRHSISEFNISVTNKPVEQIQPPENSDSKTVENPNTQTTRSPIISYINSSQTVSKEPSEGQTAKDPQSAERRTSSYIDKMLASSREHILNKRSSKFGKTFGRADATWFKKDSGSSVSKLWKIIEQQNEQVNVSMQETKNKEKETTITQDSLQDRSVHITETLSKDDNLNSKKEENTTNSISTLITLEADSKISSRLGEQTLVQISPQISTILADTKQNTQEELAVVAKEERKSVSPTPKVTFSLPLIKINGPPVKKEASKDEKKDGTNDDKKSEKKGDTKGAKLALDTDMINSEGQSNLKAAKKRRPTISMTPRNNRSASFVDHQTKSLNLSAEAPELNRASSQQPLSAKNSTLEQREKNDGNAPKLALKQNVKKDEEINYLMNHYRKILYKIFEKTPNILKPEVLREQYSKSLNLFLKRCEAKSYDDFDKYMRFIRKSAKQEFCKLLEDYRRIHAKPKPKKASKKLSEDLNAKKRTFKF